MSSTYIDKQPSEVKPVTVSFVNRLAAGQTVQNSSTVTVTKVSDGASFPSLLSGSAVISNPTMTVTLTGGSDGEDYKCSFKAVTQLGYVYEYDVVVQVREI